MNCRKLTISFKENGDVEYAFFRHSKYKLYRYLIEHPFELVEIVGGQDYDKDNFKMQKTPEGYMLLTWDKMLSNNGARGITYIKKQFLKKENEHLIYKENIKIKCDKPGDRFALWLHSPYSNISALKNESTAVFNGRTYKPRELSEIVFRESGILKVNWKLEIL